jgi:hypothetical protein
VAVTHEAVDAARRLAAGKLDPGLAQGELLALKQLAQRLGARIDLEAVRGPYLAAVRGLFERALAGRREAALQVAELVTLAMRLGMHLELWSIQNAFWAAVRGGTWRHDDEALARLAQALYFDESVVLARVAGNRERASA